MRIRFGWLFGLLSLVFSAAAQDVPGSVYSAYGFGDLRERSSAYTRAIGNTSIAVRDDNNINVTNPAALTSIVAPVTSYFEIGGYYGTTYSSTRTASVSNKFGGLTGINYWSRLSTKWAAMLGVSPASSLSYSVVTPRIVNGGTTAINVISQGSGGINQFYFGNSFDIIKNLSLGVNLSYYLGSIKKSDGVPTTSVTNFFEVEEELTSSGGNVDYGLQYTLPIKKTKIIVGLVYDHGASLSGTQQTAIVNPITFDTLRKTDRTRLKTKLPPVYGVGIAVKRNRSSVAFDLRYLEWTKASFDQTNAVYQNSYKFSGGYEFRGQTGSLSYLKTVSLRAGGWVQSYPVVVQGTYLTTWGYTLGLMLPIQNNRASVSLNYSFTQNGIIKNELVREQSRKLSIDFIFRDVWGIKRRFD